MIVLVVDDDVVSRMVLMHLVDGCGPHEIVEADDGADAWARIEGGLRPAICFCDLRMPRLSGMELLARVKAHEALHDMPFVLVSSASDRDTVIQATSLGAAGYIVKPFQSDQVRAHLSALLPAPSTQEVLAEAPEATMRRLGINGERLLVYLGGFQGQLTSASVEIAAMLALEQQGAARVRLERLHAGCVTLGLHGAASTLAAFTPGSLDTCQVQAALGDAVRAVMHQSEALKRSHAPA